MYLRINNDINISIIKQQIYANLKHNVTAAPPSKNAVSPYQISCILLSFKNAVSTISNIIHTYIQPFNTFVDCPEIGCLMEIPTMFIFADTAFLLGMVD